MNSCELSPRQPVSGMCSFVSDQFPSDSKSLRDTPAPTHWNCARSLEQRAESDPSSALMALNILQGGTWVCS